MSSFFAHPGINVNHLNCDACIILERAREAENEEPEESMDFHDQASVPPREHQLDGQDHRDFHESGLGLETAGSLLSPRSFANQESLRSSVSQTWTRLDLAGDFTHRGRSGHIFRDAKDFWPKFPKNDLHKTSSYDLGRHFFQIKQHQAPFLLVFSWILRRFSQILPKFPQTWLKKHTKQWPL